MRYTISVIGAASGALLVSDGFGWSWEIGAGIYLLVAAVLLMLAGLLSELER